VKRAILPAAISESTAASRKRRERWLAKPVGSESRYRGDEVASRKVEIDGRLKQNPAYQRRQIPTNPTFYQFLFLILNYSKISYSQFIT
jgi:hypothetical protein